MQQNDIIITETPSDSFTFSKVGEFDTVVMNDINRYHIIAAQHYH